MRSRTSAFGLTIPKWSRFSVDGYLGRNRTDYILINCQLLYQMSYKVHWCLEVISQLGTQLGITAVPDWSDVLRAETRAAKFLTIS